MRQQLEGRAKGPTVTTETPLSRRLGLWSTALSGIGIILGAGIYVIIGAATQDAGSAVWLSFVLAAVLAGMTGLAYAELSSMFPFAGASPVYIREAFGRHAGFVLGWLRLAVSVIGAAAVALGFGGYLADLLNLPIVATALLVLLVSLAIVVVGLRETVAVAILMTLLEAGGLLLILALGADTIGSRSLLEIPHGFVGLMTGAALVFFAFEGFEQIATLSEETRDPTRNIPRAILISIGISALLYVLVAITSTSVLSWQQLAESSSPLAEVARQAGGAGYASLLSSIALFATFNTALMMLATAARRAYGMANRGMLPALFRTVGARRKTPWVAALVITLCSAIVTLAGDIRFAAYSANFAVFLSFIAVNTTVIWLRWKRPETDRPFRVPISVGRVPVIPVASNLGIVVLAFSSEKKAALLVLALVAIGVVLAPIAIRSDEREIC
jgi:APA family basic amino acid/polyamine antiporter